LKGRVLTIPNTQKERRILLIYGLHASLERMAGIAHYMSRYGTVTVPDLPGFGGMQPFYAINQEPTFEAMADYMAEFVRSHYGKKRFTIVGLSLGFIVATRMLQKYPELREQVELTISIVGLLSKYDIAYGQKTRVSLGAISGFCARKLPSKFIQHVILRRSAIRVTYLVIEELLMKKILQRPMEDSEEERRRRIDFEIELWEINDIRTYMKMVNLIMKLEPGDYVGLPIYHIVLDNDHLLNNAVTKQSMEKVYSKVQIFKAVGAAHAPSVLATAEDTERYVPIELRELLEN
ncbi:MAG: alpha/beta hydrolase, partial [Candidatus Saccharimonadales bacterium]